MNHASDPKIGGRLSSRRRPSRALPAVDNLENRSLLTTTAISTAIISIQQAQVAAAQAVATEVNSIRGFNDDIHTAARTAIADLQTDIFTQRSNILTARQSLLNDTAAGNTTAIARDKADIVTARQAIAADHVSIRKVTRDEKFVVHLENQSIRSADQIGDRANSLASSTIRGVSSGQIATTTVDSLISTQTTTFTTSITDLNDVAMSYRDRLLSVFLNRHF